MASPNTAFKRKPIAVAVVPPTPGACPHCGAGAPSHPASARANTASPKDPATWSDKAQKRISELEAEVRFLTDKSSTATSRVADCEDELAKMKSTLANYEKEREREKALPPPPPAKDSVPPQRKGSTATLQRKDSTALEPLVEEDGDGQRSRSPSPSQEPVPAMPPAPAPVEPVQRTMTPLGRALTTTRITNFLTARRLASPISPAEGSSPADSIADLSSRLNTSETQRKAAEEKLTRTNQELEELTASLFQTANEMVSKERREHAEKAEEREKRAEAREEQWTHWQREIEAREKTSAARTRTLDRKVKRLEGRVQTLEQREKDKSVRLERLENAMRRAGRVRGMLDMQARG